MNARRRFGAIAGAAVLTSGLAIGATVALPGSASAAACTNSLGLLSANTTCTTTGTITLTGGLLTMGGPSNLTWSGSVTGAAQTLYDASSSNDQTLYSSDLRGIVTGATSGWNITAVGTAFTGTAASGNATLPTTGVLGFGGGANSTLAAARPTAACIIALTCSVPVAPGTGAITYPAAVPTGGTTPTPTKIYNAAIGSGAGGVQIGGGAAANPATWSVALPAVVAADTYTSTVTLTIAAGP